MLKKQPDTSQACISIYDGKELNDYMDAKYGKSKRKKNMVVWQHVKIVEEAEPNEDEDDEDGNDLA